MVNEKLKVGLTFDDVLLVPAKSGVLPRNVDTKTNLTKDIALNIPIISAAMDTVTESCLAIAIASEGGIGIIHKNLSPENQTGEVKRVKKFESGIIQNPVTISPKQPISEVVKLMENYHISGVPVTEKNKLVGIITNRDIRFEKDMEKPVFMVMTKKVVTAPIRTTFEEAKELMHKYKIEKLPLVNRAMNLKGLITIRDIEKKKEYPDSCKDEKGRLRVGAAVGVGEEAIGRAELLINVGADVIVIDTAHGHTVSAIDTLKNIKKKFDVPVIVGNIATKTAALDLIKAGADAIKVGIGPGSICTTRIVSGIGVPQITAIAECYSVAKKYDIPVIADGGIKYSGEITKALAAGASSVMIGSLFAGTEESPGESILYEGRSYKTYRGMGSLGAMQKGSKDRYGQAGVDNSKLVPEGIEGMVPYKGRLNQLIFQLVGGLRSGMGYCGCKNLAELRGKSEFIRITNAGLKESHVHDVTITKESPNYSHE